MRIREMFNKPIDRDIKGVIKVGQADEENVGQELEEYVVTRQLATHFADFFANYKKSIGGNTDKMGVWISGFFGSGKSHFLKILSYLLENREVNGKTALDYFISDNKIADPMVLADMKKCADMASKTDVILFNIDSKIGQNGSQAKGSILSVFLKVFNEMQGFYGSRPHLADLERELTEAGRYDEFKHLFQAEYGNNWEESRHKFSFIQDTIVKVLSSMDFMSEAAARNWCAKATGNYDISIEGFARLVADYIKKKGGNHHVVFLVDEIGQYIGGDSRLMLNLQTITEDLGTACRGKAWVVVTSQQDIDSIINDMGIRAKDFSKIQGRFDTKLSLSSANVDEVIKKRVLAKNDTAAQTLRLLYGQKETIVKNLIVFNDSVEKKLYSGEEDFTAVYPFVPYQFNLLASVLTSIRTHGASGKHLSEGERSMLALFQESVVRIMKKDAGAIIPFNLFYDALHGFLDHSHAGVIIRALDNDKINPDKTDNCFAVEVLKTLFMVKYVNEIEANTDNLVSLLADSLDVDRMALKRKVEDSLKVLEGQRLVQKNGDAYVFLTDEEQEINREISGQNVEMTKVTAKIAVLIFDDDIFKDRRYRYPAFSGRYTFAFNQYVDDHPHRSNQSYDIGVQILTPNSDIQDETTLRMMSGQSKEVLVVLPSDRTFFDELRESMKIEKYLTTAHDGILTKYKKIKADKSEEMRRRADDAKLFLEEALKNADIYVNGDKIQVTAKDVTARLNDALSRLVESVYHKLPYIEKAFSEADIRRLFAKTSQQSLTLDGGQQVNAHASNDMLDYIAINSAAHTKTSLKTLLDRFMRAPYGFVEDDIKWLVAKLFLDGDISFTVNSASVSLINNSEDEIIRYITKRDYAEKLLTDRKVRANEAQKKAAREVMKELFGTSGTSDDDDAIMQEFQKCCLDQLQIINNYELISQGKPYPGKKVMEEGKNLLRKLGQIHAPSEFFKEVSAERDTCLDLAEDFEPVKAFFGGEQKKIFDDALDRMRIYNESKNFIVDADVERYVTEIKAILTKAEPYADIHKLPGLIKNFSDAYMAVRDSMSKPIYEAIEDARRRVMDELDQKLYKDEFSTRFSSLFVELKDKADHCNNVATFQSIKGEADALKINLLNELTRRNNQLTVAEEPPDNTFFADESQAEPVSPRQPQAPEIKRISIRSINTGGTWQIRNKGDVDAYIEKFRQRLYHEIEEGILINIEF